MATGNFIEDKGYDASAALTIYRAVKLTAAETVSPVAAKTDVAAGVTQFGVTSAEILKGKGASIRVMGATEMEVSGTATVGALAGLNADGTCHDAAAGDRVIGYFRQGAATGGRASVQLNLPGYIL